MVGEGGLTSSYRILGLDYGARPDEVRDAFRRLAKKHHPDLRRRPSRDGDAEFVRVVRAYQRLRLEFDGHRRHAHRRRCPRCGRAARLLIGLDGMKQCAECMLGVRPKRFCLPLPTIVVVKHLSVILLQAVAIVAAVRGVSHESLTWLAGGLGASLVALVTLAITCTRVVHTH
jgi:hypothetical protein